MREVMLGCPVVHHSPKRLGRGRRKIHTVMEEYHEGSLKSSSGQTVTSRKQAVAIALSEARRAGAKIPKKRGR